MDHTASDPLNPHAHLGIDSVPYERQVVQFVDTLLDVAKKKSLWEGIRFLYEGWCVLYPQSSQAFEENMKTWRDMATGRHGIAKEGDGMIQHQLEVPRPLYDMIKIVYPDVVWDKKFVRAFAQRFGQFKGTNNRL